MTLGIIWSCAADPGVPELSRVCVARAQTIMLPESVLTPKWLYPDGKLDYSVVERLLDQAMMSLTGKSEVKDMWTTYFGSTDTVGIQLDVAPLPVHDALLEAVLRRLSKAGVPLRNIIIYSGEELALFRAGFDLAGTGAGARVMGTDGQGFRNGLSRVLLDYCTAVIDLSRLRVDPQIGMSGVLANALATVPYEERVRLRADPENLAQAASRATVWRITKLHIVDLLQPGYRAPEGAGDYDTWDYGGVMVSEDPVAADTIGRQVLVDKLHEEDPGVTELHPPVRYLQPATERYRLGNSDRARIELSSIGP